MLTSHKQGAQERGANGGSLPWPPGSMNILDTWAPDSLGPQIPLDSPLLTSTHVSAQTFDK